MSNMESYAIVATVGAAALVCRCIWLQSQLHEATLDHKDDLLRHSHRLQRMRELAAAYHKLVPPKNLTTNNLHASIEADISATSQKRMQLEAKLRKRSYV